MHVQINQHAFERAFADAGRKDSFSYAGLNALFDYLEELEESTGEPHELDVVALCCEFTEYASCVEAARVYDWTPADEYNEQDPDDLEAMEEEANEWLLDQTMVIGFDDGVIIADF